MADFAVWPRQPADETDRAKLLARKGVRKEFIQKRQTNKDAQTSEACHSCGEKGSLSCIKCENNICEACAPEFTHECIDARDSDLRCGSCVTRCPACQVPICRKCTMQCHQCWGAFCFRCDFHGVVGGHTFAPGDTFTKVLTNRRTIKERRKAERRISLLPTEIIVLIFEHIHGLTKETSFDSMRDIINLGMTAPFVRTAELKFWTKYVKETLGLNLQSERPKGKSFYLHLSHMPKKYRNDPKQIVLYSNFCCDHCGQKNLTLECRGCRSQVCYQNTACGQYVNCDCEDKAFHCKSCHEENYCEFCYSDICKECDYECILCHEHLCKRCFHGEAHKCWNSEESDEEQVQEVKQKQQIKCIQCNDDIEAGNDEEMFGHCSQCEYYNEINGYKLCKSCVVPCPICLKELCGNCMEIYHAYDFHWTPCRTCSKEWSMLDGACYNCEKHECCFDCQFKCDRCKQFICESCAEDHYRKKHLPVLPDDVIFEIFKFNSLPRRAKTIDSLKSINQLSLVSKQFKRVEQQFWRHIVDSNPFFKPKMKKFSQAKDQHLKIYFGCTSCDKPTPFKCHSCETHICLECFEYIKSYRCKCEPVNGIPTITCCIKPCELCLIDTCGKCHDQADECIVCNLPTCPHEAIKLRCYCQFPRLLCNNCATVLSIQTCTQCEHELCTYCKRTCQNCLASLCPNKKCSRRILYYYLCMDCPPPGMILSLPPDILTHVLLMLMCDVSENSLAKVISVLNASLVNRRMLTHVSVFFTYLVSEEGQRKIKFALSNQRNYMPSHITIPKQQFLWRHFSCINCGMLDMHSQPIELISGEYIECERCHYARGPFYFEGGVQYICQKCYGEMLYCCNSVLPAIENSEQKIDKMEVTRMIKCIQCHDDICDELDMNEEFFGNCSLCEYYNEINGYKLCKTCIITCSICLEDMCINCMTLYHEPCEEWEICRYCQEEKSMFEACPCTKHHQTFDPLKDYTRAFIEKHYRKYFLPELPDEIILLIMKASCPSKYMKTLKWVKWIVQLGSVNKQFKRAENHFWRQIVDSNSFFSSKMKKSNKLKPKELHLKHYFGCNDCGKPTKYRCSGCDNTNMCLECYKYSRIEPCDCADDGDSEPVVYCRSCITKCNYCRSESCPKCVDLEKRCSIGKHCEGDYKCIHRLDKLHCLCDSKERYICQACSPLKCHLCSTHFCNDCAKRCQYCLRIVCDICSIFFGKTRFCNTCTPFPDLILQMPQEVTLRMLEMIICDENERLVSRVIAIINFGLTNRLLNAIETIFWKLIVAKEMDEQVHLLPYNRNNSMLATQATSSRQFFLWQHFSCVKCHQFDNTAKPVEIKTGETVYRQCVGQIGPFYPETGVQCICQKCFQQRLSCTHNCKTIVALTYRGMTCHHCLNHIVGDPVQCRQCDHRVEFGTKLPGLKMCNACTTICPLCYERLCYYCIGQHHPCQGRLSTCQKCHSQTHTTNFCNDCDTKGCNTCLLKCQSCDDPICEECLQRSDDIRNQVRLCRKCSHKQLAYDPMDLD